MVRTQRGRSKAAGGVEGPPLPCQAAGLGTKRAVPRRAARRSARFGALPTAVAPRRSVAQGRWRALRKGLGEAQAAEPRPRRWAAPRATGGPPKVRFRRKSRSRRVRGARPPCPRRSARPGTSQGTRGAGGPPRAARPPARPPIGRPSAAARTARRWVEGPPPPGNFQSVGGRGGQGPVPPCLL